MTNLPVAMRIAISLVVLALSAMFTIPAHADAVAEAKAANDAFSKAFEACDVPAVMALYEDNAVLIWPGQGEFAIGKPAIEKDHQRLLQQSLEAVDQGHQQRRAPGRPRPHHSLRAA